MILNIIPISIVLLCSAEALKYGYQRYGRFYGKKNQVPSPIELPIEQPITPKLPVNQQVNLCPQIVCPLIHIPEKCRKETFINTYGVLCKGCDQNVCDENGKFDNSKLDPGSLPIRGDFPGISNSLQQFNGEKKLRWMDTTPLRQNSAMFEQNDFQGNFPSQNNIHWQNNLPVWQNDASINNQFQKNVPLRAQWHDNVPFNTQWQDGISHNTQLLNNGLSHTEWINNGPAVNNPINNWQNNIHSNQWLPGNQQLENTFASNNNWQGQEQKMNRITFLGNIVQNIPPGNMPQGNPWERVPFQTPQSNNQWQNAPFTKTPGDNSRSIFKGDGGIGSPITGLPMQITGKSIEPEPMHIKSDQNLGFTNPFFGKITFGNIADIRNTVYEANSPGGFKNTVLGHLGGK